MGKTATPRKRSTAKKKPAFSKEQYLAWHEQMLLVRRFEERCNQEYIQQKIRGFLHLYIGQEAIAAGSVSAMRKGDKMITAYRDHGFPLVMGTDPKACMAELFGKATGCTKGKGGSMHFFDVERGFYGGHGIVGGQIPLGAGMALAEQYNGTDNVVLCLMGDGAVRQGSLHETFNMAMTWKLPVIFIVENNNYAMGTSVERTSNVTDLWKLGLSYDMPGEPVNAMSVEEVHNSLEKAMQHCRDGKGPFLLEFKTYRYKGHSMSDPQKYRSKDEVADYKAKDPINQVRQVILDNKWATEDDLKALDKKIKAEVAEAAKFADESPFPDTSELYKDVYLQEDYPYLKD